MFRLPGLGVIALIVVAAAVSAAAATGRTSQRLAVTTSLDGKKVLPQIQTILNAKTAIVSTTEELSYPG